MFQRIQSIILMMFFFFASGMFAVSSQAQETKALNDEEYICAAYITGIGCHNCAIIDPILLQQMTAEYPQLVILEYEVFKSAQVNSEVKDAYFDIYAPGERKGVPFFVVKRQDALIGRLHVAERLEKIDQIKKNSCPMPNGSSVDLQDIDFSEIYGKVSIWTKNRVFISEDKKRRDIPKKLFSSENLSSVLERYSYKKVNPIPVMISEGQIDFQNAVLINGWRLQWTGEPFVSAKRSSETKGKSPLFFYGLFVFLGLLFSTVCIVKTEKGIRLKFSLEGKRRDWSVVIISLAVLFGFFQMAKNVPPDFLEQAGYSLPLPVFTFLIALVDGFNPCNMFVLTCLLVLLVTTSHDRKRLYVVALSFVVMVFIIYYLFMAAWLNVFKTISFIKPLRIAIGGIALIAGIINCKELLFFKKGISLTIPEKQKGPLLRRINAMKDVITHGSYPLLISSSIGLATLASFVELPCTAGFPIIYTGVLAGRDLDNSVWYYFYLGLYNLVYVTPLLIIISIFIYSFKAKYITQRQVEILKFVGGFIMIVLGIILLVSPQLIGLKIG